MLYILNPRTSKFGKNSHFFLNPKRRNENFVNSPFRVGIKLTKYLKMHNDLVHSIPYFLLSTTSITLLKIS